MNNAASVSLCVFYQPILLAQNLKTGKNHQTLSNILLKYICIFHERLVIVDMELS